MANSIKKNGNEEKYWRRREITIQQLSGAINLILSLTIAGIGFILHLLINNECDLESCQLCLYRLALGILLISGSFGIWCTINRLRDFRISAQIYNHNNDWDDKKRNEEKECVEKLGEKTWNLFRLQILAFSIGAFILIIDTLLNNYITKLLTIISIQH